MVTRITSAYNFVPLQSKVVLPPWAEEVSHDLPFKDGLCAEITVNWRNDTPLLVGDMRQDSERNSEGVQQIRPFRWPDGTAALPGSALRGMVRNVVEIATFGAMRFVDDMRLSFRDLSQGGAEYKTQLVDGAGIHNQKEGARPRAQAAWLWFDGENWRIVQTGMARVEHDLMRSFFRLGATVWPKGDDQWRPTAHDKYELLHGAIAAQPVAPCRSDCIDEHGHIRVLYTVVPDTPAHLHSGGNWLRYQKVAALDDHTSALGQRKAGVLVVTGQPNPRRHMEFVFEPCSFSENAEVVGNAVMAAFLQVNGHDGGDWKARWSTRARRGSPIPVFRLVNNNRTAAIGLAQMFRLPGAKSIADLVRAQQAGAGTNAQDFASLLFGGVGETPKDALRGRVSFGDGPATSKPNAGPAGDGLLPAQTTVLGQPKPGFYPNYLAQSAKGGQLNDNSAYVTILSKDAKIRGWKRYPVRALEQVRVQAPPDASSAEARVELHPLAPGHQFSSVIRLHNVKIEELGAVVWALTWGGRTGHRHAIGLAKGFGFGQIAASLKREASHVRSNETNSTGPTLDEAMEAFVTWMDKELPGWNDTAPIKQLLAMADPKHAKALNATALTPLRLEIGSNRKVNEFVEAKNAKLVLPDYAE